MNGENYGKFVSATALKGLFRRALFWGGGGILQFYGDRKFYECVCWQSFLTFKSGDFFRCVVGR